MAIVKEGIRIITTEVCFDTTDGQIHLSQFPCGRIGVLTEYGNIPQVTTMVLNKLCALNEHTTRSTAGVIHTTIVGLQYLNQCTYHAGGGIELTSQFSFLLCKFRQAVFIGSA